MLIHFTGNLIFKNGIDFMLWIFIVKYYKIRKVLPILRIIIR